MTGPRRGCEDETKPGRVSYGALRIPSLRQSRHELPVRVLRITWLVGALTRQKPEDVGDSGRNLQRGPEVAGPSLSLMDRYL